MKIFSIVALAIALLAAGAISTASGAEPARSSKSNLPADYPGTFDETGFVSQATGNSRRLSVNANGYRFSTYARVHSDESEYIDVRDLEPSTPVGLIFRGDSNVITDIWVLPDGYLTRS